MLQAGAPVGGFAAAPQLRTDVLRCGWRAAGNPDRQILRLAGFVRGDRLNVYSPERIGDDEEATRCAQFLRDSSEEAYQELSQDDFRRAPHQDEHQPEA